jgi:Flp pilus assembly pilin Flp
MTQLQMAIAQLVDNEAGQDLIEYGLLVALIALVAVVGVRSVGSTIFTVFWSGIGQAV